MRHAGPRRDALRSGRVIQFAERSYRLRHRDLFDRLLEVGAIDQELADVGRQWVALYRVARLVPDVHAMELERRGHGTGEMSDHADAAHARFRAVVRALQPILRGPALDLADERTPATVHPAVVLRAVRVILENVRCSA